jgi:hypothetical protein
MFSVALFAVQADLPITSALQTDFGDLDIVLGNQAQGVVVELVVRYVENAVTVVATY